MDKEDPDHYTTIQEVAAALYRGIPVFFICELDGLHMAQNFCSWVRNGKRNARAK